MNGIQIEHVLGLIDSNIHVNMESVRSEILEYLTVNGDTLAQQISERGYAVIPTRVGEVRVSQEDLKAA
jgi:hypothetical protein